MPGLTSATGMISTLPALGRIWGDSAPKVVRGKAAKPIRTAAIGIFMGIQNSS